MQQAQVPATHVGPCQEEVCSCAEEHLLPGGMSLSQEEGHRGCSVGPRDWGQIDGPEAARTHPLPRPGAAATSLLCPSFPLCCGGSLTAPTGRRDTLAGGQLSIRTRCRMLPPQLLTLEMDQCDHQVWVLKCFPGPDAIWLGVQKWMCARSSKSLGDRGSWERSTGCDLWVIGNCTGL